MSVRPAEPSHERLYRGVRGGGEGGRRDVSSSRIQPPHRCGHGLPPGQPGQFGGADEAGADGPQAAGPVQTGPGRGAAVARRPSAAHRAGAQGIGTLSSGVSAERAEHRSQLRKPRRGLLLRRRTLRTRRRLGRAQGSRGAVGEAHAGPAVAGGHPHDQRQHGGVDAHGRSAHPAAQGGRRRLQRAPLLLRRGLRKDRHHVSQDEQRIRHQSRSFRRPARGAALS
mmetsp:Transcript_28035/g.64176  ORF Transcript_28035/g.64176 Transcript_28035/m.64176 type:complete len:225 (+) Transcript_28035:693-1367(+)